ncbi:MAG: GNAT family N-acetyltransferase [Anaerolineae bacterium]
MANTVPTSHYAATLSCQIEALSQDLDWTLAHFTFVADMTTLADDCDIVCSPAMSVASYHGLPFPALAFLGNSPELLYNYTTFLVEPGSEVTLLVNAEQRDIVEAAFLVSEIIPEWQLVYRGDPTTLDPGHAEPLRAKHVPAMQKLAHVTGLTALEEDPLSRGPAYGIWEGRTLVAMGNTHLTIPQAAELGNIATHPDYRRRGYATHVVSALVRAHAEKGLNSFAMVYQSNVSATRAYEKLGFEIERPLYLIRCFIEEKDAPPEFSDHPSRRGQI